MSDKLNEKFETLVTESGLVVEMDAMPTVTAKVIPGGGGPEAPGAVSDAQTRGGSKEGMKSVGTDAVNGMGANQSVTDNGGTSTTPHEHDEDGEENPGAKASAPISPGISDAQTAKTNSPGDMGKQVTVGTDVAYGTSNGPKVSYPIKPAYEDIDLSDDVNALVEGGDFSEDFKAKAKTIFEAAVKAKLSEEWDKMLAQFESLVAEKVEAQVAELSEEVNGTINYAITNWVEENHVQIDRGLKSEITEDFIAGLKTLFTEHWIDIPEGKENVVEEMADTIREMEEAREADAKRLIELNNRLNEQSKVAILSTVTEGLTDTQKEKLLSLAEGVKFESTEKYTSAVKTLRESYFPTQETVKEVTEDVTPVEGLGEKTQMDFLVDAVNRYTFK
jgi:hypothetical protein